MAFYFRAFLGTFWQTYAICFGFLLENGFMARARKKLTANSKLRREMLVWSSTYLEHAMLLEELKQNQESVTLFSFLLS